MKNFLLLAYDVNPESGGIERYLNILMKEFARETARVEVCLVGPSPRHPLEDQKKILGSFPEGLKGRIRLHRPRPSDQTLLSKILIILKILWVLRKTPIDVIHCGHLHLLPLCFVLSLALRRPIILYLYGIEFWGNRFQKYLKYLTFLKKIRNIVTISDFSIQELLKNPIPSFPQERIVYIPPVLDQESFSPQIQDREENKNFTLLTVARLSSLEKYKGHEAVLTALALLEREGNRPHWNYHVVGDGDDRERLQKMAKDLGLLPKVRFLGRVSDQELSQIYRKADVFIMPSRSIITNEEIMGEGFGIVFLEASAYGLPLIGPNVGGPTDIIVHEENGFQVDPHSPEEIAEKIGSLYDNRQLGRKMGKAAYELLNQRFTMNQLPFYLKKLNL